MKSSNRYLLVTHIPFTRNAQGSAVVDGLWARDLIGLVQANGPVRVVAPELPAGEGFKTWGPNTVELPESSGITFRGFPPVTSRLHAYRWLKIRAVLRDEVQQADVVHTSNFFPPYAGLSYAHHLANRLGKKTLFVIAEDFYDMLSWEWVRPSKGFERWRRERGLRSIDRHVRDCATTASLTFLHTPAAVERYRLSANRSFAIRQPGHELDQVISSEDLELRLDSLRAGRPLHLVAACRHSHLKGLDFLIRAIALLARRSAHVRATLYGSGPETSQLLALAVALGVADRVAFPGALPAGPELDAALRQGDLLAMPHRTTDFGRAFFDGMAAGLPVLAFRTPASQGTVVDGDDGFLIPLDDVAALAERIGMLHADRNKLANAAWAARQRATLNTRSEWYRLRAEWTNSLFDTVPEGTVSA